ncbi:hypothetical protein AUJ95_03905 [Candidatus Desantisbacteria bacterium CG2_30_40_21]|uniref:Uncharacterized protein n=3 Tax=unclassified Candidatus Desantisiibacteriota TaxID=3106372 RepID=A0A2M7P0U8_9BACT|nr:MAG: hypothetical protein AUJ95_03905 [Candidatus Desantisbacteria bacterium CG2_30_40_21]PIP40472.1 MAG: hypothetical protein COX18_06595 [Candidatus Desantisbacteria bacterium CG23_combo_of_CG06-09_8_20_14_all_40_23]PIY18989.1 MAG: hypothetical protein COZ13_07660 [Candidatus Desantisbacteria bacterium CG_4_10_14_3_um_filter_40_18]
MYNRKRREKLADLLFDLVKFILTIGIVGSIFTGTFRFPYLIWGVLCTLVLVTSAYFLTPKDKED